jgi:hypothetical protein
MFVPANMCYLTVRILKEAEKTNGLEIMKAVGRSVLFWVVKPWRDGAVYSKVYS